LSEATRDDLLDFQAHLADKLKAAEASAGSASKLGFMAGARHWLVSLDQVNEVVTIPGLAEVPWAQPWFAGVASVRGVLYGCTDLGAFAGLSDPLPHGETRILLAHPRFGVNAALRIERALGLRGAGDLREEAPTPEAEAWILAHWRTSDGVLWTEISMERLVAMPAFLEAAL
jgi:twitching motility protein PilI